MTIQQGGSTSPSPRWRRGRCCVYQPYVEWAIANGEATLSLDEQRLTLEEQRAMHERHMPKQTQK